MAPQLPDLSNIKHVILDIEGTVSPIDFVKQTLYGYTIPGFHKLADQYWSKLSSASASSDASLTEFKKYVDAFPSEHRQSPETMAAHITDLQTQDLKIPYLKEIQGYIWRVGFHNRDFTAPLFTDVIPAMKAWSKSGSGKDVSIYSSGSIPAQKMLFSHVGANTHTNPMGTTNGDHPIEDYTSLVRDFFSPANAGPKREKESYEIIAKELRAKGDECLFLSDIPAELKAAKEAGWVAVGVDRPGNAAWTQEEKETYSIVKSFEWLR